MSSTTRAEAAKLAKRFAKAFNVSIDLVVIHEFIDDVEVSCPSKPELPKWSLGLDRYSK